jgi:hypothetical protein
MRSLISAREAARQLATVGLGREQSRLALAWGLAGEPVRTAHALLYPEQRVRDLVERPCVAESELAELCPSGVVVIRCGLRWPSGSATISGPWDMKATSRAHLRLHAGAAGFPLVVTVSGFVVEVAAITDVVLAGPGSRALSMLELGPAGDWASLVTGRRFPIGPGGRWLLWQRGPARTSGEGVAALWD